MKDTVLWEADNYVMTARMEHVITNEGEITLHFKDGPHPLYGLSFSFVPGKCLSLDYPQVILISRMQGRGGEGERIAQATKACGEITPQASLYCALLGIAAATDVGCLAAVSATNQICYSHHPPAGFTRAYDDFFNSTGATARGDGFYILPLPARAKPLAEIVSWHRRRTKIKRQMKSALTDAARQRWQQLTVS